ncbi:basic region leucine zipper [Phlyctema vagabunda]|uniref:Basic region leucine zipper n=1 Tax=Phlyctema vagabunda TaxID=108571 RepID=A0ABR4P3Z7_9HELO
MSAYNGRRGPNVSEYIANLNAIPSAQEMASQQEYPNIDDDLAMFTNTQFFDFDLGQDSDFLGSLDTRGSTAAPEGTDSKALDFNIQGDFSFPDFNAFSQPQSFALDPIAPAPAADQSAAPAASAESPSESPETGSGSLKRKSDAISSPASGFEDSSRAAAEEDKRRRNTAASARFRVKKKQREQALERSAKEMSDKVAALEGRINLLETENKWLKNLIVEKNENKDDIAALWLKYTQEQEERKGSERKDGVGTEA